MAVVAVGLQPTGEGVQVGGGAGGGKVFGGVDGGAGVVHGRLDLAHGEVAFGDAGLGELDGAWVAGAEGCDGFLLVGHTTLEFTCAAPAQPLSPASSASVKWAAQTGSRSLVPLLKCLSAWLRYSVTNCLVCALTAVLSAASLECARA